MEQEECGSGRLNAWLGTAALAEEAGSITFFIRFFVRSFVPLFMHIDRRADRQTGGQTGGQTDRRTAGNSIHKTQHKCCALTRNAFSWKSSSLLIVPPRSMSISLKILISRATSLSVKFETSFSSSICQLPQPSCHQLCCGRHHERSPTTRQVAAMPNGERTRHSTISVHLFNIFLVDIGRHRIATTHPSTPAAASCLLPGQEASTGQTEVRGNLELWPSSRFNP